MLIFPIIGLVRVDFKSHPNFFISAPAERKEMSVENLSVPAERKEMPAENLSVPSEQKEMPTENLSMPTT